MHTPNILVINQLSDRHISAITNSVPGCSIISCDLADAEKYIDTAEIIVAWGWMDLQELYLKAPKLRWVHALSAGVEKMLFPEMISSSTLLTNSRGIHGIPMSEHVISMILAFTRGLNVFIKQQQQRVWKRTALEEIHEKTIGIIGLGSIGREIAKRAKGLGMRVVASKREMTTELFVDTLYTSNQIEEVLAVSDFVVVTLPETKQTQGLFTLNLFKLMKPSAYFINVARGSIVKEDDLSIALSQGIIKGAALDVFENEPLPESSPLWDVPNVIITPHIAAISPHYLDRAMKLFCENLACYCGGQEMVNIIDKTKGY
ncbi:D-2-hydroxyacid dehydrogenase [Dendrosporobacter sp. 1207_IL3150]|uniref:D-2-hydroxyacid dehydrogenase n=1 Tax=Dendrosporobacter sp. 1207_IL3150 TaxID=3084054 RepID=UPI002FD9DA3A